MPFYFLQRFAAFCKGFLIFLKGFLTFLDGFPLSEKSQKIHLRRQVYKRLLFKLRNSSPLHSPSFIIATCSPSIIIATMPTSHPTKAIRMSRCKFGGTNISPTNFTPVKKYFSHVIIAILLLFLHKYHVFALSPSSLIHITNNEHKKIIHKFNDLQINYPRRTALIISFSAYSNVFSTEYATSKK